MSEIKAKILINENGLSKGHMDLICDASYYDMIYSKIMRVTNGDHEIAADAASWCELASPGEIYEFREGRIELEKRE